MKVNCKLCLILPWMGVFVQAGWRSTPYIKNSVDKKLEENAGKLVKVVQNRIHEESLHGLEATKRYSDEPPKGYLNRVPSDFARDISRLRIPDESDIPRGINSDEAESDEAPENSEENSEDKSEENRAEEDEEKEEEEEEEEESSNEEAESEENQSREKEEDDRRRPEYDEYDESPPDIVYESKKEPKKPQKKRPNVVHYEVTEKIPDDTKPQRPRGPVYPLPPPCPGAPPPTFPPPPPPATKSPPLPPPPPPPRPAPPKGFYVPLADVPPPVNHIPFLDSYFPTSYAAQTHSIPEDPVYIPRHSRTHHWAPVKPKVSGRFPRRASPQRVIIRYHRPTYVVRKIQPVGPASDAVIVRHGPPPPPSRPKEVHIHHHHGPRKPEAVIHVHKNDEDDALEEAKFTADLAGQKLFSEAELEAASSGPFAEPPDDFSTDKESATQDEEIHFHE